MMIISDGWFASVDQFNSPRKAVFTLAEVTNVVGTGLDIVDDSALTRLILCRNRELSPEEATIVSQANMVCKASCGPTVIIDVPVFALCERNTIWAFLSHLIALMRRRCFTCPNAISGQLIADSVNCVLGSIYLWRIQRSRQWIDISQTFCLLPHRGHYSLLQKIFGLCCVKVTAD